MRLLSFVLLFPFILSCTSQRYTEVVHIDQSLSLVQDSEGLYFKSKGTGDCPYDYYSNFVLSPMSNELSQSREYRLLSDLIDLPSFKFERSIHNQYYFIDINHRYLVLTTLCDNTVSYEGIE